VRFAAGAADAAETAAGELEQVGSADRSDAGPGCGPASEAVIFAASDLLESGLSSSEGGQPLVCSGSVGLKLEQLLLLLPPPVQFSLLGALLLSALLMLLRVLGVLLVDCCLAAAFSKRWNGALTGR